MVRSMFLGALYTILGAFPIAAMTALVYRFPIPFAGYRSGLDAMMPAMMGVILYGMVGGFPLLAFLGAGAGAVGEMVAGGDEEEERRGSPTTFIFVFALWIDVVACAVMAVLDKIIGPW